MFKVSQEIRLNTNGNISSNISETTEKNCIFGKYQRTPDADAYPTENPHVFIAPELTDASKVQLLHFPNGVLRINTEVAFIIRRNGVRGNFELKLENPAGVLCTVPLRVLDPERIEIIFKLTQAGLYKLHIKCNSVPLPRSPFLLASISGSTDSGGDVDDDIGDNTSTTANRMQLPAFQSDARNVVSRGLGLNHILLNERNQFTVDASAAGNNILFVGILGPNGHITGDEVIIRHMGKQIYNVSYRVQDAGNYLLALKWGDEHVPGSPFALSAN